MSDFIIDIKRIGTDERVYREQYTGDQQGVERRASFIWSQPDYCSGSAVGRYRLKVFQKGSRKAIMTID